MVHRVVIAVALVLGVAIVGPAAADAATPPEEPPAVTANPFLPEERDLTECVSALPQPGCGSEERGGWRQVAVFGVVVVGLSFVGWRITRTVRRHRRELEPAGGR